MARMKIEFQAQWRKRHGGRLGDALVAHLPRWAPVAAQLAPLFNLRDRVPGLAGLSERFFGVSAQRSLPRWRRDTHRGRPPQGDGPEVVLLVDTFNRYFEPENAGAVRRVLDAAGYRVIEPETGGRPLCCGRTYLAAGMVDAARAEARRLVAAVIPYARRGVAIVGLEPSCLLTLRDEYAAMLPAVEIDGLAERAQLFEEFLVAEKRANRLNLDLKPHAAGAAWLHGHCHQKAFGLMPQVAEALALIPELAVKTIESGCCGMAGAFGYEASHFDVSMRMAELDLLPAVRQAPPDALIVADGTSCRHQIHDGAGRQAIHVARVLEQALAFGL